jgi:hypothetical protein
MLVHPIKTCGGDLQIQGIPERLKKRDDEASATEERGMPFAPKNVPVYY